MSSHTCTKAPAASHPFHSGLDGTIWMRIPRWALDGITGELSQVISPRTRSDIQIYVLYICCIILVHAHMHYGYMLSALTPKSKCTHKTHRCMVRLRVSSVEHSFSPSVIKDVYLFTRRALLLVSDKSQSGICFPSTYQQSISRLGFCTRLNTSSRL